VRVANLALRFLLELAALAALAYWGAQTGSGAAKVVLAMAAPLAAAIVWGLWCAPRSRRRLPPGPRTVLETAVFGLAAAGLAAAGQVALTVAFVVVSAANWALLFAWRQDP
jgi:Protein of unknown function (DUF2568)